MKTLVIGNGFIASEIIRTLDSAGHDILIFSKSLKDKILNQQIVGSIFDAKSVMKALDWKPQVVVHTAWVTAHQKYSHDVSNYDYAKFTSEFAGQLINSDVEHFIVLGSCAEYGPQFLPSSAGKTSLNPTNPYAEQKVAALNSVKKTLEGSAVRLSWVRIFQPYGPNQDEARLIPYLIKAIKNNLKIDIKDSISRHDWVTTRDIAAAIAFIIKNSLPIELDVGTTVGHTNIQVLRTLENLLGDSKQWEQISLQSKSGGGVSVVGKDSPLFLSGWKPNDSLEEGLSWVLNI
jgi:UDP-glucuronate decarboxylase